MTTSLFGRRSHHAFWAASAFICLLTSPVHASDDYPAVVQQQLGLPSRPECTLCHANLSGGTGTVVTYFGLSMQDFGARGKDPASLERALTTDTDNAFDSDGDGVDDVTELASGTDPNDGPGPLNPVARPQHGCSMTAHASDARWLGAAWGLLAIAVKRRARTL